MNWWEITLTASGAFLLGIVVGVAFLLLAAIIANALEDKARQQQRAAVRESLRRDRF